MMNDRIDSLQFLHGTHMPQCYARVKKRFEGYVAVQFMEHGGLLLGVDTQQYRLRGAWFWITPPGPLIWFHPENMKPWNHRYIAVGGKLAEDWIDAGLCPTEPVACPPERVPEMCATFSELHHNLEIAQGLEKLRKINRLENLLLTLEEFRKTTPQSALRRFVEERFVAGEFRNPDYAAWAAELRMAESTLRRRFREETGETLHRFIQQLRIAQARRLLRETPFPLWLIAEQCGYSDEYYFNRHFQQNVGMPPAKFRKSVF